MNYQGVVSKVSSFPFNGKNLWSFQLQGIQGYFRCGEKRPNIEQGNLITFNAEPGKNGSFNVDAKSVQIKPDVQTESSGVGQLGRSPVGNVVNSGSSRDWPTKAEREATQARIERQSCRNSALEFIKILVQHEALKVPAKNKVEFFEELLAHYQDKFLKDNSGEVVEPFNDKEEVAA